MLVAAACSQCRRVDPTVTGVDLRVNVVGSEYGACVRGCVRRYRTERREEQMRFVRALRACRGVSACLAAERKRHFARRAALMATLEECKRACYNEGSGNAGE